MSTMVVRVCEECGSQSANADGWLVISGFDIRTAKTGEVVIQVPSGTDLCSPGCVLRYVSKQLKPAMNGHSQSAVELRDATRPMVKLV
jgi:hypothetical protein